MSQAKNRFSVQIAWPDGAVSKEETRKDVDISIDDIAKLMEEAVKRIREYQEVADRIKCAVCGLIYPKGGPYPACRSENGPTGPEGMTPEERKYMKCVLAMIPSRASSDTEDQ